MEAGKPSMTAQLVAGLRAAHFQSGARPLVFEDPYAAHFTGGVFLAPLARAIGALGFDVLEDLSPEDLHALYFAGRSDGLRPNPVNRLMLRSRR